MRPTDRQMWLVVGLTIALIIFSVGMARCYPAECDVYTPALPQKPDMWGSLGADA